jgi:hypothetical protein
VFRGELQGRPSIAHAGRSAPARTDGERAAAPLSLGDRRPVAGARCFNPRTSFSTTLKRAGGVVSALAPVAPTSSIRNRRPSGDQGRMIRDWHSNGVRLDPVPANNAVHLDTGPQSCKAHVFGVTSRSLRATNTELC